MVFEMELYDVDIAFRLARTHTGKQLEEDKFIELLGKVNTTTETEVMAELLTI